MKYKNLKDVFFASKFHVGKGLATYDKSLDPVVFDQLADMNAVANSEVAMNAVVNSEIAMNAVANSEIAMNAVVNSEIAMNAVVNSEIAMNAVANSEIAMNAVVNSEIAMNAVVNSEIAMNAVVNSEIAMNAVGASNIAIGKLAVGLAGLNPEDYEDMNAVVNSEIAMNAVANSEIAMNAVVNSEIARFALTESSYLQQNRNTIVKTLETGVSKGLFVKYSTVYIDATGKYNSTSNWAPDNTIEPDNSIAIIKAAGPYTDGSNATTRIKHLQNPDVVVFVRSGTVRLQSVDNYVCIGGLIHEETGDSYVRIDGYEAV